MYKDITGIILSGGKSSRLGRDKSFIKFGDRTLIEITVSLMKSVFENVIISTNSPNEYLFLNCHLVKDKYKNAGPLAGIYSALLNSKSEKNFIISCDVPLMTKQMIEYFIKYDSNKDIIISKASGYVQPLVGIYKQSVLPIILKLLNQPVNQCNEIKKNISLHSLIKLANTEIIDITSLPFYTEELFFNLNTHEDLKKLYTKLR